MHIQDIEKPEDFAPLHVRQEDNLRGPHLRHRCVHPRGKQHPVIPKDVRARALATSF